ncbi:MAG: hypothetical protein OEM64_04605 [Gammaproteobacteria bacterium]|nr:hypothetical protein [Gammaproteobacteria bacterium]
MKLEQLVACAWAGDVATDSSATANNAITRRTGPDPLLAELVPRKARDEFPSWAMVF